MTRQPIDVDALHADDQLIEDLRAGHTRDADDLERSLTAMRDHAQRGQQ